MLGRKEYEKAYINASRKRIEADLEALASLGPDVPADVATRFCNNLVLVLDHTFVHRLRGVEGKDGNPLNEVRILSESLLEHGGELAVPKNIKLDVEGSVLGFDEGDEIALDPAAVRTLANAFFNEIEARYT